MRVGKSAARVRDGVMHARFTVKTSRFGHIEVKDGVFPSARFPGFDAVLGPEMKSTGEVMGIDRNFAVAFAKSQIGGGGRRAPSGAPFVSVHDAGEAPGLEGGRRPVSLGVRGRAPPRTPRQPAVPRLAAGR